MKSILFLTGLVILLLVMPVAAQDVHVNYSQNKDFSTFHTYAWGQKAIPNTVKNPALAEEVRKQINAQLQNRGLKMVGESRNPDLVLVVSGGSKKQTTYSNYDPSGTILTTGTDYGVAETSIIGALVVDIYDVKAKQVIWRATATDVLSKNNAKNLKLVDDAVDKMFKKYPYPLSAN